MHKDLRRNSGGQRVDTLYLAENIRTKAEVKVVALPWNFMLYPCAYPWCFSYCNFLLLSARGTIWWVKTQERNQTWMWMVQDTLWSLSSSTLLIHHPRQSPPAPLWAGSALCLKKRMDIPIKFPKAFIPTTGWCRGWKQRVGAVTSHRVFTLWILLHFSHMMVTDFR